MAGTHARLSRRRLLELGAAVSAAVVLGGRDALDSAAASVIGPAGGAHHGTPRQAPGSRTLYRHAAVADGRSAVLAQGQSLLVESGRISWVRPSDAEPDPGPTDGLEIVDVVGLTVVPGLVDAHCHLTSPGGAHYIERFLDPPRRLLKTAERNGRLARRSGVAWLREVGSPTVVDPIDGRRRALALGIRDRWSGRADRPVVRAAGTWIAPPGGLQGGLGVVASSADEMVTAAQVQLDQGADLVKLYVEAGHGSRESPWTADEIRRVVDAAHGRAVQVTAHAQWLGPARAAVAGGVDAIEHGFNLDAELCSDLAARGVYLVTTLSVPQSWLRIGATRSGTFWSTRAGKRYATNVLNQGLASASLAQAAGVMICAGTDFGGGSTRAGQLAREVESLVRAGLEPWQALGAATWRGGELIGEAAAGRIIDGGPADFFIVDGDPYSDPGALWNVRRLA